MSYSVMMVEPVNLHGHSVAMVMAFTSARHVLVLASIVRRVLLNNTYLILCIGLRCVILHMCQAINLTYPAAVERLFLRADILM